MKVRLSYLLIAALAVMLLAVPGHAAPLSYEGSLELRTPVWANQDVASFSSSPSVSTLVRRNFEPSLKFLDLAGSLRITRQGSPLAFWVNGEHSFSRGYFIHENKMRLGLDLQLGKSPATLFSYFERRFDGEDLDRVFVGVRCGFRGDLD